MAMNSRTRRNRMAKLVKIQGRKCYYCGGRVKFYPHVDGEPSKPDLATIEHIIPLSRGGSNDNDNLVIACHACNNARGNGDARDMILKTMGLLP